MPVDRDVNAIPRHITAPHNAQLTLFQEGGQKLNFATCTEIPPEIARFAPNHFKYLSIPPILYVIHLLSVQAFDRIEGTFVNSIRGLDEQRKTSCAVPTGINGRSDH